MGRRKIEIKKIDNKAYLKATFSKRRKGLFRKAAELCDMCGAEIAILTVSPGGKFYNFGHPDVDSVIYRYCGDDTSCTVEENHDCVSQQEDDDGKENHDCVSHEDDRDEDLEGEQEKEFSSTDEEDEPAGEEKELVDDQTMEMDLIGRFKRRMRIDLKHKYWWDEKEPSDPEQLRMYYLSLAQLRNNVVWTLNDRKRRESYTKDYIGGM